MDTLILASSKDPAATNIVERLITNFGFTQETICGEGEIFRKGGVILMRVNKNILKLSKLGPKLRVDTVICVSRHSSGSRKPTLTAHIPGNLGSEAPMGGEERSLAWADPYRLRSALIGLLEAADQLGLNDYSVSLEATHHGPTQLPTPILFIEVGSTPTQWMSPRAGEAAASAAMKAATEVSGGRPAVGFGGGHYAPKHTRSVIEEEFAVGHIIPEYFFEDYESSVIDQAFRKTVGGCRTALIDWKGFKSNHRRMLLTKLEEMDVEVVRS
ncbi:MAG: D-aminoacyl-tRNA deacylase [Candidatus Bathyarchaeia archaeon]